MPPTSTDPGRPSDPDLRPSDWALFLDFDGTLVEIADRPDAVVVDPTLVGILRALRERLDGALAVITGRPIAAIDAYLAPELFDAAGLHGAEHRLAGRFEEARPEPDPALREAVAGLARQLSGEPGLLIEDKGPSVAVHWRLAPHRADRAGEAVLQAAAALGGAYRLQWGKAVAEIVPAGANKGRVIERFLDAAPYRGRRPVFAGDDLTDEHGFAAVNARDGVSLRVGEGPTEAQAVLPSPAALRLWLSRWAQGDLVFPPRSEAR